jgi:hypothetical protein
MQRILDHKRHPAAVVFLFVADRGADGKGGRERWARQQEQAHETARHVTADRHAWGL